ncbi:hypothetical protein INH39_22070 [Massilia violaceinigra]|uniref:Uncharacterized protein n=1 Tax=Massilia violaceinigra TaxID=2045208 RepID=A0ABY4A0J3_9BURK|nr:hypothetical protein [Massilia violaceinigra]UOD28137.1 hypothetical protein INH39_22070 [Massilia violaceinigra]
MADPHLREQATQAGVMASFLHVGAPVDHASSLLLALGVLCALLGHAAPLAGLLALLLGLGEKYFAWRAALDAELFAVLARDPGNEAAFDTALGACMGRGTPMPQRTLAQRWPGARRFLLWQIGLVLAQALLLAAMLLLG